MTDDAAAHRASQAQLYGAPLAQIVEQIGGTLGLTQGRIAGILGLSAPMLSHLVSGRRVKIGNPVAHVRLTQLRQLADDVVAGRRPREDIEPELVRIAAESDTWSTTTVAAGPVSDEAATARRVQELFRHVADAADWLEVAATVEMRHPQISELLRVYGAGRTSSAEHHWTQTFGDDAPEG